MRTEWLVGGGVVLILAALFLKRARARQAAVIAGVICLVVALRRFTWTPAAAGA